MDMKNVITYGDLKVFDRFQSMSYGPVYTVQGFFKFRAYPKLCEVLVSYLRKDGTQRNVRIQAPLKEKVRKVED